jgi:hypothetical protein
MSCPFMVLHICVRHVSRESRKDHVHPRMTEDPQSQCLCAVDHSLIVSNTSKPFKRQRRRGFSSETPSDLVLITFRAPAKARVLRLRLDLDILATTQAHDFVHLIAVQIGALGSLLGPLLWLGNILIVFVLGDFGGTLLGCGLPAATLNRERSRVVLTETGGDGPELVLDSAESEASGAWGVLWSLV